MWQITVSSERGQRDENQDNYLIITENGECEYLHNEEKQTAHIDAWKKGNTRIAVIDGMGGHQNGRQFAESVVAELMQLPFQCTPENMKASLLELHNKLFETYYRGSRSPGSTLVIADISPKRSAVIANIGDSRAFLVTEKEESQITRDHILEEMALRDGLISDDEFRQLQIKQQGKIAQALGFGCIHLLVNKEYPDTHKKQHSKDLELSLDKPFDDIQQIELPVNAGLKLASDGAWDDTKSDNVTIIELKNKKEFWDEDTPCHCEGD